MNWRKIIEWYINKYRKKPQPPRPEPTPFPIDPPKPVPPKPEPPPKPDEGGDLYAISHHVNQRGFGSCITFTPYYKYKFDSVTFNGQKMHYHGIDPDRWGRPRQVWRSGNLIQVFPMNVAGTVIAHNKQGSWSWDVPARSDDPKDPHKIHGAMWHKK